MLTCHAESAIYSHKFYEYILSHSLKFVKLFFRFCSYFLFTAKAALQKKKAIKDSITTLFLTLFDIFRTNDLCYRKQSHYENNRTYYDIIPFFNKSPNSTRSIASSVLIVIKPASLFAQ